MRRAIFSIGCAAFGIVTGACNSVGDCPAASAVTAGGSCSTDNLECPYTLPTPDGGMTSCVCQMSAWSCPSVSPSSGDDAAGDSMVEAGGEAATEAATDGTAHEGGGDAAAESSEAGGD